MFLSKCYKSFCPYVRLTRRRQHGTWASEDSVSAEECQETGRDEEGEGSRSKDGSQGSASVHLRCVQVPDARPKNFQATL